MRVCFVFFFFFNDTATTEIYTLSLHDALPIYMVTGKSKVYRHVTGDPRTLSDNVITQLRIDHSGTLWANTGNGLNRYDAATDSFTSFRQETDFWSALYVGLAE